MYSGPALGLFTSPNPFSQTPAGTLATADNVRFTAPGVIEPRRGFDYLTTGFGNSASRADALAYYAGNILAAYDLTKVSLYTSSWSDFTDTFEPVGDNRMRFEGAARSVFFNTQAGLYDWDGVGVGGQPVLAGNALPLTAVATNKTANGWQEADTAVAYRTTICSKDAFGRIIEGPPSGRTTLKNQIQSIPPDSNILRAAGVVSVQTQLPHGLTSGDIVTLSPGETDFPAGAKTVTVDTFDTFHYTEAGAVAAATETQQWEITRSAELTIQIVAGAQALVTTSNFLRIYRSEMTALASDTPSDEMFQCYETGYVTATQIAAGEVVIDDIAPETVLNVPLYTNTNTGVGALQANHRPPRALDIVYWAQRMWFANTENKDAATFSVIGTGSPDGVQVGDTFTVSYNAGGNHDDYTAIDGNLNVAPTGGQFSVFTNGDPGWNIERTAQSLVEAINSYASNEHFVAFYVSSEGGIPGTILIQSLTFDEPFALYSSRAEAWTPQLPTFVAPAFAAPTSDTNKHPAGLFWSRLGQPEAVPLVNFTLINSDNDEILRIFPLHYRLLVFKTDGIYTCSNQEPFTITKLSAYKLLAPDSLCVLEDRVYALTDQGIVTISDSGPAQISNCIDDLFNAMMAPADISTLAARSFGLAYRSERQALMWCPESQDDGSVSDDNAQALVYSTLSEGFTRYGFGVRCAVINPEDNSITFAPTDSNKLVSENKALDASDYYDLSASVGAPASVSGAALTFSAATAALIAVGDVLASSSLDCYPVTDVSGVVVTVSGAPGWTGATTLTLYKAISTVVDFNKLTGGAPAELKSVAQASFLFRTNGVKDVTARFASETTTIPEEVTISGSGWGSFPWGGVPYGSPCEQIRRVEPIPSQVAVCAQFAVGFATSQAMAKFDFLGVDVVEAEESEVNFG